LPFGPEAFAALLDLLAAGRINAPSARLVLAEMAQSGEAPEAIVERRRLAQVSDAGELRELIAALVEEHPEQLAEVLGGKREVLNWFFGQVMAATQGKANPALLRNELEAYIAKPKD
ncbi:MAG TPA: GatB/YqeY domain-containing protein, partial [Anaerolineales bacterium]